MIQIHNPPLKPYSLAPAADTEELIVDGEIIDLNRIPLPADTPIIDERFKQEASKLRQLQEDAAPARTEVQVL